MGFNPYRKIQRARMTRRGDVVFIAFFTTVVVGLFVWALS